MSVIIFKSFVSLSFFYYCELENHAVTNGLLKMVLNHNGSKKAVYRLFSYFFPYKEKVLMGFLSVILIAVIILSFGKGLKNLVDIGISSANFKVVSINFIWLISLICGLAVGSFGRSYYFNWLSERVGVDMRKALFEKILTFDISFFDQRSPGSFLTYLMDDISLIQTTFSTSSSVAIRNIFFFIGGLFMMITISPQMAFYSLLIVPVIFFPLLFLGKIVRRKSQQVQSSLENLSVHFEECLSNIRIVQAFNRESLESKRFYEKATFYFKTTVSRNRYKGILSGLIISIVFSFISILLWFGLTEVWAKRLTMGDLSSFIFYTVLSASSLTSLADIFGNFQKALGAADRIFSLMGVKSSYGEKKQIKKVSLKKGILAFHKVSFVYPHRPENLVLDQIMFSVSPGENIAIVGPSGAGKSTLFSLLLRFYDPQSGNIYCDGADIKDISVSDLRESFGLVSQDTYLFSSSIYDNILYGNPKANLKEIWEALEQVNLKTFVESLPHGINTFVGTRGVKLSGGQKQRLSIARAIIKNPRVLLLDEATNSLDSDNTLIIQNALKNLKATRTTLIIAHQLSTVLSAHRILVLKKGKVESIGTHAELVQKNDFYRRLCSMRFMHNNDEKNFEI